MALSAADQAEVEWLVGESRRAGTVVGVCWRSAPGAPCELDRLASELSITESIRNRSASICCELVEKKALKRRPLAVIAASSLYAACRESRAPVTIRELAAASGLSPKEVGRCYRSIMEKLQISPPIPNGTSYAAKVASRLKASERVLGIAEELLRKAVERGFGVRNPMTLAAAALYVASLSEGVALTQADVAQASGASVLSVRESVKGLRSLFTNGPSELARLEPV